MKELIIVSLAILSLLGCASGSDPRANVNPDLETPRYAVSKVKGGCELRRYQPYLVASVTVTGDFDSASSQGFRALAGYIFGGNSPQRKVAMTAPVSIKAEEGKGTAQGERVAMTSPVSVTSSAEQTWEVTFSMPSKYTLDTLPQPNDKRVKLSEHPGEQVAVIVFSGRVTDESRARHEALLLSWLKEEGLTPEGPISVARYNDPFTLPWNRRNELLVKVKPGA